MTPTLDEIARKAGVSRDTVRRALQNQTKATWASTAQRVQRIVKIAQEMGYRPNSAARAVATGRFGTAALIVRREAVDFFPYDLIAGLTDALADENMHMVIARMPKEQIDSEVDVPKVARELAVDGLLIHEAVDVPEAITTMIDRHKVPAIWLNAKLRVDCVYPDDLGAAQLATRLLIAHGHRRILYLGMGAKWNVDDRHYSQVDRQEGYRLAMTAAGLKPAMAEYTYPIPEGHSEPWEGGADLRVADCRKVLSAPDRPTAIVCPSEFAPAALLQAAAGLGLVVPRDLSIIMFCDRMYGHFGTAVSNMRIPMYQVGRRSVELLAQRISRPGEVLPASPVAYEPPALSTIAPAPGLIQASSRG